MHAISACWVMVSSAKLDSQTFLAKLKQLSAFSQIKTWWLAYSGGVDSQVLLHLMSTTGLKLQAVYIDHGLQAESAQWAQHCRTSCQLLNIPFQTIKVDARPEKRQSPEAAARIARYGALKQLVGPDDCLLTAQHEDDQAETFLLQLFRGGGAAGLAAMPFESDFGDGYHCRPLLSFTREQILEYAREQKLDWIEDPSNQDSRFDRNFLRNQAIPLLKQRWPSLDKTLHLAAVQQAENKRLLEELAVMDLEGMNSEADCLSIDELLKLSEPRVRNALRYWLDSRGFPLPSRDVLQQIILQIFQAESDRQPLISWANVEVRRFRGCLYAIPAVSHDASQQYDWHSRESLDIQSLQQTLVMREFDGRGLPAAILNEKLQVRFRQGGEKIRPAGRNASHSLKKLCQEADIPPWQRDRLPLIYLDGELIAVANYWIADEYATEKAPGLRPELV